MWFTGVAAVAAAVALAAVSLPAVAAVAEALAVAAVAFAAVALAAVAVAVAAAATAAVPTTRRHSTMDSPRASHCTNSMLRDEVTVCICDDHFRSNTRMSLKMSV